MEENIKITLNMIEQVKIYFKDKTSKVEKDLKSQIKKQNNFQQRLEILESYLLSRKPDNPQFDAIGIKKVEKSRHIA